MIRPQFSALEGHDVTATQFPLAASGGVFLSIVGVTMVLGALRFRFRNVLLAAGAALATIVIALVAPTLTARAGVPTIAQSVWLAAAVAAEIVLLAVFIRRAAPHGERAVVLTVLGIVAAHFLPMAPAFGPAMIVLGLLCAANVLLAARVTDYSLRSVWAVDGALKVAIGALLFAPLAVDGLYSTC
jgi:uncharacterized membrane protein HdeD (DUF308 family)